MFEKIINFLKIFFLLFFKFLKINSLTLKVNYFYDSENLCYINPLNNSNGDLYFEFYGNSNNIRYISKINITSGKEIYFNNDKVKQINSGYKTTNHESIIININGDNNDYIFTISYNKCELININEGIITSKSTYNLIYESDGKSSYRNYLLKLNDNNYILSFQIEGTLSCYVYINKFKFESNTIENYKKIEVEYVLTNFINSTSCFQTTKYIQCSYCGKAQTNILKIVFYDFDINEKNSQKIADAYGKDFMKIIHIRDELGAYVYFDYYTNIPNLQINILNDTHPELKNYYNFSAIELNGEGKYTLNNDIFLSDVIKINDTRI